MTDRNDESLRARPIVTPPPLEEAHHFSSADDEPSRLCGAVGRNINMATNRSQLLAERVELKVSLAVELVDRARSFGSDDAAQDKRLYSFMSLGFVLEALVGDE